MVRSFQFHEQKLLKKVDFLHWKKHDNLHAVEVMRRYRLPKREDYQAYNRLCGEVKKVAHAITLLDPKDPFRRKKEEMLLNKLHHLGLISKTSAFSACDKLTVSAFCR
jgi:U3 small nucleolar ribonucleoprotein protein IMP3